MQKISDDYIVFIFPFLTIPYCIFFILMFYLTKSIFFYNLIILSAFFILKFYKFCELFINKPRKKLLLALDQLEKNNQKFKYLTDNKNETLENKFNNMKDLISIITNLKYKIIKSLLFNESDIENLKKVLTFIEENKLNIDIKNIFYSINKDLTKEEYTEYLKIFINFN